MAEDIKSTNIRVDGFIDKGCDFSNSICKKYTLIEHVKMIGDNDTDFIIELVPHLIETYDIQKQINEGAKSATLKGQIEACLKSGGNPDVDFALDVSQCGDISDVPDNAIDAYKILQAGKVANSQLPDDLKKDSITQADIDEAIRKILIEKGLLKDVKGSFDEATKEEIKDE